ncbi:MAG: phosphodiesterase [Silicimonas sp.]|nr:phosphodiesterase [Silicimonas sp.]
MMLPPQFLKTPLAHRALHDVALQRPENSAAAVQAAVDAGYGIEIDVQVSSDNRAIVFHDYDLARLTDGRGAINERRAEDLSTIPLTGGGGAGIPGLSDVLAMVGGQVPLLIEIKDQDGALGPEVGVLEAAVADALQDYAGAVAVMSFNPHSMVAMQTLAPEVPRGLVTEAFQRADWGETPISRLISLTNISDYERVGASFISHNKRDLHHPRVAELKSQGARILTWTIRSPEEERKAREIAENITFEGYLPAPAP